MIFIRSTTEFSGFLSVESRSNNGLLTVELYDTEPEEVNVNAALIELGHARTAVDMPLVFMKHPKHNLSVLSLSNSSAGDRGSSRDSQTSLHIIPG